MISQTVSVFFSLRGSHWSLHDVEVDNTRGLLWQARNNGRKVHHRSVPYIKASKEVRIIGNGTRIAEGEEKGTNLRERNSLKQKRERSLTRRRQKGQLELSVDLETGMTSAPVDSTRDSEG